MLQDRHFTLVTQIQEAVYNNFKQPVEIVEENKDKITFQYNAAGGRAHMDWGRNLSGGIWGAARYRKHYSADGSMEITEDAQTENTIFDIHLQSVGLIHMNGRLYDPVLHRFLMPDNYVQDPYNSQNFNRYSYVLNNPLRYTDPTGELTESQWAAAMNLVYTTFVSNKTPNGGYIEGDMGSPYIFSNRDVAFGFGVGHMNEINGWGGGGSFASSAADAHRRFNRGILTPEIVAGLYNQLWSGQYYNIGAAYSPDGRGFNISSTSVPGQSMEVAITYASYEQVQRLMYGQANQGAGWDNSKLALDIGGGIYGALQTAVKPGNQWLGKNGKYYNNSWGGNQYTGSRSGAFKAASRYKLAGVATVVATTIIGGIETYNGYLMDGGQFGYNAQSAAAQTVGGIGGSIGGAALGAEIGAGIGVWFGGVGAIPGAIIGGFVGGFIGGNWGSTVGQGAIDLFYGR